LALLSIVNFIFCLTGIKKDDSTAVYGVDLISYYTAAQLIKAGEISEIYAEIKDDFSVVNSGQFFETAKSAGFHLTPTRYVYLPIFLAPFELLTKFSFPTATTLWLILNLICVIAVISLEWYFTKDIPHPTLRLMMITSLNLCLFPLFYALKLGQTSIIVYLAVCLIYYFTVKNQDLLGGILLGIIIALKFLPLLFIFYFLCRKRYTLVITCTLTVLTILLTSIIIYGLPLHKMYWNYLSVLSSLRIAAWSNQSIDAFLLRLFTKSTILHFYPIKVTTLFSIVSYTISLSVIGIVYLCLKGKMKINHQQLYPLEFSSIILCLLIAPSISWLHYFTLATLSFILIVTAYYKIYPYRAWIIIPSMLIGYVMVAFHPNCASLVAAFGQGYLTKLVVSFPFTGTCLILLINLSLMKVNRTTFSNSRFF
jgi:hypothetical protein